MSGGQRGSGAAMGSVISVSDSMMTVGMRDGASKVVIVTNSTKVMKSTAGTKADVVTGSQVIVTGTPNSDGSITADSIQIRPIEAAQTQQTK